MKLGRACCWISLGVNILELVWEWTQGVIIQGADFQSIPKSQSSLYHASPFPYTVATKSGPHHEYSFCKYSIRVSSEGWVPWLQWVKIPQRLGVNLLPPLHFLHNLVLPAPELSGVPGWWAVPGYTPLLRWRRLTLLHFAKSFATPQPSYCLHLLSQGWSCLLGSSKIERVLACLPVVWSGFYILYFIKREQHNFWAQLLLNMLNNTELHTEEWWRC